MRSDLLVNAISRTREGKSVATLPSEYDDWGQGLGLLVKGFIIGGNIPSFPGDASLGVSSSEDRALYIQLQKRHDNKRFAYGLLCNEDGLGIDIVDIDSGPVHSQDSLYPQARAAWLRAARVGCKAAS